MEIKKDIKERVKLLVILVGALVIIVAVLYNRILGEKKGPEFFQYMESSLLELVDPAWAPSMKVPMHRGGETSMRVAQVYFLDRNIEDLNALLIKKALEKRWLLVSSKVSSKDKHELVLCRDELDLTILLSREDERMVKLNFSMHWANLPQYKTGCLKKGGLI